jgi:DNA-binding MarR family transcriptional regulator
MEKIILNVRNYLQEILGQRVQIQSWEGAKDLPFFLADSYYFYEMALLRKTCLLMVVKKGAEITPALVRKHWEQVLQKWNGLCIFVQEAISSYNRKRLIEHRVPFVIPGNQLYLPDLGIDLREHFHQLRNPKTVFSPATQALLIFYLLNNTKDRLSPSDLAQELGYTKMTMTRAFDELDDAGIGKISRKGRERFWNFHGTKRELWEQVKSMLRSPIKMRIWAKHKKPQIIAGLSALAHLTMLNPPSLPVYAISWEEWKNSGIEQLPSPEEATFELEVWYYDPQLFTKQNLVDPLSLYLSLEASGNERIESSLEELMESVQW